MNFIYVGIGGAIGAILRYSISLIPFKGDFPLLTLITNAIGAFAIGVVAAFAAKNSAPPQVILFIKTGICGGFTTFSTFSLEAYNLFTAHNYALGALYVILSVILCLAGVHMGMKIM